MPTRRALRAIPSVDRVVRDLNVSDVPRPAVVALVRRELAQIRLSKKTISGESVIERVGAVLADLRGARLRPVINGTGVVIHTNLGRSPLGPLVVAALVEAASDYNNLELDLAGGDRGGRAAYLEHNLAVLCGAGAATFVNNCAAALVLILRYFTTGQRKQVIISRGELVQIGGGFRVPEILQSAGAALREVGTTNKTSLSDYSRAIGKSTAMILGVHRSNFFMQGFVESSDPRELAALAQRRKLPFVLDLGSGATSAVQDVSGVGREPTPAEILRKGADLVCFSGDKLLGGPQAGIIAGKAKFIAALKRDPLFRALRCDKLTAAALQTTTDLHLAGRSDEIPIMRMLRTPLEQLRARAQALAGALAGLPVRVTIGSGMSQVGGGSLPRSAIPSVTLDLAPEAFPLKELAARLRAAKTPVVGYLSGGKFRLDLRTIFPRQDDVLAAMVRAALAGPQ